MIKKKGIKKTEWHLTTIFGQFVFRNVYEAKTLKAAKL